MLISESQQEPGALEICCETIILNDIVEMVCKGAVNNDSPNLFEIQQGNYTIFMGT